jgi:hypothetical protein
MNRELMAKEIDPGNSLDLAILDQIILALEVMWSRSPTPTAHCHRLIESISVLERNGVSLEACGFKSRTERFLAAIFRRVQEHLLPGEPDSPGAMYRNIDSKELVAAQSLMEAAGFTSKYFRMEYGLSIEVFPKSDLAQAMRRASRGGGTGQRNAILTLELVMKREYGLDR